jgi:hypothetical protein
MNGKVLPDIHFMGVPNILYVFSENRHNLLVNRHGKEDIPPHYVSTSTSSILVTGRNQ